MSGATGCLKRVVTPNSRANASSTRFPASVADTHPYTLDWVRLATSVRMAFCSGTQSGLGARGGGQVNFPQRRVGPGQGLSP